MTERSFEVGSMEAFRGACAEVLETCAGIGDVAVPCQAPQPWNDPRYKVTFSAPTTHKYVAPRWQFQAYPSYQSDGTSMCFMGLCVLVTLRDATMGGKMERLVADAPVGLEGVIDTLEASRVRMLGECEHRNHVHVRNVGRCCNEYRCTDCGHVFQIDSGD